ncbi:MAG: hemerythrin domain-containing protein [Candidatus Omnitrophica bacterium]|nr:hemerythrin domain-containing protein [Candidatus Omnitrophota bacterium]MDE2222607.1 hemerythrin domain-containing protein [Candidatus Omnitrophota bacterium]
MPSVSVTRFYSWDHDALDKYLTRFHELKRVDFEQAKLLFKTFMLVLKRHMLWEEEIVFPAFETKTKIKANGPTAVMRHEHVLIKDALDKLHQKVRERNFDSDEEEHVLLALLAMHGRKEEAMIYPAMDRLMTAGEKEEIFRKMEAFPIEDAGCGCGQQKKSLSVG